MIGKLLNLVPASIVLALLIVLGSIAWVTLDNTTNTTNTALCASYSNNVEYRKAAIELCVATPNCLLAVDDIQKLNQLDAKRKHFCEAVAREEAP